MTFLKFFKERKFDGYVTRLSLNDYIIFFFSFFIICLLIFVLLNYGYGRDQSIFSIIARTMLEGGAPYKDAWDFKTPGIYFIYAFAYALFGVSELSLRLFEIVNLLLLYYGFAVLSKRVFHTPWAAVFPALISTVNYVLPEFWHTAQPESFAATTLTWAIVFATYEKQSQTNLEIRKLYFSWIIAAALFSISGLLKPPLGGGIIVSFILICIQSKTHNDSGSFRFRTIMPALITFSIGGFIPVLLTLLYLFFTNSVEDFYNIMFVYLPNYTALMATEHSFLYLFAKANYMWLLKNSWLHLLGILLLFVIPKFNDRERLYTYHIIGAIFFSVIGIVLQAKFFKYHFAATLTLSGLLSGWGIWKLWMYVRLKNLVFIPMLLMISILGVFPLTVFYNWGSAFVRLESIFDQFNHEKIFVLNSMHNPHEYRHISKFNMNAKANHLASLWIAKNTSEDSSIYVWGFEPSIYLYSNRSLASRYIYNVAQRTAWSKKDAELELMADLQKSKPAAIVIQEGDVFDYVTGNTIDSRQALMDFPAFQQWLTQYYNPAIKFENLEILSRK